MQSTKQSKIPSVLMSIGDSKIGGGQIVFLNILKVLKTNNFKVTVVIPKGALVEIVERDFLDFTLIELPNTLLGKLIVIFKLLKNNNYDLISTHLGNCAFWFTL
ncbi:MAG: hypothetical protein ISR65_07975, partial [Bacteriovoracaceae bacterium]|nr:hypothetical protein [Bacteriovoracaceae bacterium]